MAGNLPELVSTSTTYIVRDDSTAVAIPRGLMPAMFFKSGPAGVPLPFT